MNTRLRVKYKIAKYRRKKARSMAGFYYLTNCSGSRGATTSFGASSFSVGAMVYVRFTPTTPAGSCGNCWQPVIKITRHVVISVFICIPFVCLK